MIGRFYDAIRIYCMEQLLKALPDPNAEQMERDSVIIANQQAYMV